MNQLFHVGLHVHTRRRRHLVVIGDHRARVFAQPLDALANDAIALAHFFHAHQITVVAIAVHANRDVEIDAVVHLIRLLLAHIPFDARTTQHRTGETFVKRTLRAHHADTNETLLPNPVVGQQRLVLVNVLREAVGEVFNEIKQRTRTRLVQGGQRLLVAHLGCLVLRHRVRQVAIDAARTVVGGVHARARHRLIHIEQVFTLAEGVQEHRHGANVQRVRTNPHQVVHDPRDFVEHDADVLRTQRHF